MVQQTMSAEQMPVLLGTILAFEMFMTAWEHLGDMNSHLRNWTSVGVKWAVKYYQRMDQTCAYVVSMGA